MMAGGNGQREVVRVCEERRWAQCAEVVETRTPADEAMEREEATAREGLTMRAAMCEERGERLGEEAIQERLLGWHGLFRFVFQDGLSNPWAAFQNFVACVNRVCPEYLGALSQTQIAALLGQTRAAVSAREIRVVEEQMRRWGVMGYHGTGGTKSTTAREAYRRAQMGNKNRRDGQKRKQARKAA